VKSGIGALSQVMVFSFQLAWVSHSWAPYGFELPAKHRKVAPVTDMPSGMVTWNCRKAWVGGLASIPTQLSGPKLVSGSLE